MNVAHQGTVSKNHGSLEVPMGSLICVLLERKCPVPPQRSLTNQLTQKCSNFNLVDGELQLQKTGSRRYYMQVQLTVFYKGLKSVCLWMLRRLVDKYVGGRFKRNERYIEIMGLVHMCTCGMTLNVCHTDNQNVSDTFWWCKSTFFQCYAKTCRHSCLLLF